MSKEYRTTEDVLKEKYEERGWNEEIGLDARVNSMESIKPLPISEKEYRDFSLF